MKKNINKTNTVLDKKPEVKQAVAVKSKRTEVLMQHKPTLILSDTLISKVELLHKEVAKNIEWSAILLYSNKVGNVDTPENWVIDVQDLILMDIGSSGYTEYDISSNDAYASDKFMDALEAGVQIGHLHSHFE